MAFNNLRSSIGLRKLENSEMFKNVHEKLSEKKLFTPALDFAEKSTKVDRVYLVSASVMAILATLLLNYGFQLIAGSIGFLYPAYKTMTALERKDVDSGWQWLTYWLVFCAFNFLEIFLFFLYWFPGYWFVKSVFYLWCYAPFNKNGSMIIYEYVMKPVFQRNREMLDGAMDDIVRTAHTIYTHSEGNENQ